jgi:hypothetical protein
VWFCGRRIALQSTGSRTKGHDVKASEKVRQLLALARSTPFAPERESAVQTARTLFNKYRLTDAHLRWELLTALGHNAGPEPLQARSAEPAMAGTYSHTGTSWYERWSAAGPQEQERWSREWFVRWRRQQQAQWAWDHRQNHGDDTAAWPDKPPQPRQRQSGGGPGRRRRKRVRVRGHWSPRSFLPIEDYTRTITTRPLTFTCRWCQRTVTQQRFPGPRPVYCSEECKTEARREQTRERVRRYRARQQR